MDCDVDENELKTMKEYGEMLKKEIEEDIKKDNKIIEELRKTQSKEFVEAFLADIEDSCYIPGSLEFVDEPEGMRADTEDIAGHIVYINQTINGGFSGDSFAGDVYVKIGGDKYIKYDYSM